MNEAESAYAPPKETKQQSSLMLWLLLIAVIILAVAMAVAILFLVSWVRHLQAQRAVAIQLEEILNDRPVASPNELQVDISKEGEYSVNCQVVDEAGLMVFLHAASMNNPGAQTVHIRAHRDVPFRHALTVTGICQKENLSYYCTVWEEDLDGALAPDPSADAE
jgi:biopolymer transport protein ExbD